MEAHLKTIKKEEMPKMSFNDYTTTIGPKDTHNTYEQLLSTHRT
jgi:hypothetical protein